MKEQANEGKPSKRWQRWLLALGVVLLLLFGGGVWFFSSVLMYPGPFRCDPKRVHFCGTPAEQKLPFAEVTFQAKDGTILKGWWIPAAQSNAKPQRAVIFSHGRGAERRVAMRFAAPLHRAGFHILTFDYRHCGKSQKRFNSMGGHEQKDLIAAVDFVQNIKKIKRIGVYGLSLGASISIMVTAKDKRIKALIAEGGFAHLEDVIVERGKRDYGLPRYPLLPVVMALYGLRTSTTPSRFVPEDQIAKISPRPVRIVHGTADTAVYPSHAKRLFRAAKQPKQLWLVPKGGHTNSWQHNRSKAEADTVAFFSKHL